MSSRREFITLLGGAAAAWPIAARAQQPERMRRIGVVMVTKETDPETPLRAMAFRQALAKLGWSEGRNVVIDFRFGAGDLNRMRAQAKELTGLDPDVAFDRIATARGYPVPDTPEQKAWLRDIFVGADLVSAPEGRQSVARGVSPWNPAAPSG